MRDLGELGETKFIELCNHVGLIATKPSKDKRGWDFFVECPSENLQRPEQLHENSCEFKIQVKATDSQKRSIQVKLSNLRNLCVEHLPTFMIVFEFEGKNQPQRAFLIHYDEELIEIILKKIHDLQVDDPNVKLNKMKMSISYDASNQLNELTGECLHLTVTNIVGTDPTSYTIRKTQYLKKVGYDKGFAEIKFKISGIENLKKFRESTMGIPHKIPVECVIGVKSRFGKSYNVPFMEFVEGYVELSNIESAFEGSFCVKKERYDKGLSFPCRYYSSAMNDILPEKERCIRLENNFVELKYYFIEQRIDLNFVFSKKESVRLSELNKAINLMSYFSDMKEGLQLEMFKGKDRISKGRIDGESLSPISEEVQNLIEDAYQIAKFFDISNEVELSIEELWGDGENLTRLSRAIKCGPQETKITFDPYGIKDFDYSGNYAFVIPLMIKLSNYFVGFHMVFFGDFENAADKKYVFQPSRLERECVFVMDSPENYSDDVENEMIRTIEAKFPDTTLILKRD